MVDVVGVIQLLGQPLFALRVAGQRVQLGEGSAHLIVERQCGRRAVLRHDRHGQFAERLARLLAKLQHFTGLSGVLSGEAGEHVIV